MVWFGIEGRVFFTSQLLILTFVIICHEWSCFHFVSSRIVISLLNRPTLYKHRNKRPITTTTVTVPPLQPRVLKQTLRQLRLKHRWLSIQILLQTPQLPRTRARAKITASTAAVTPMVATTTTKGRAASSRLAALLLGAPCCATAFMTKCAFTSSGRRIVEQDGTRTRPLVLELFQQKSRGCIDAR